LAPKADRIEMRKYRNDDQKIVMNDRYYMNAREFLRERLNRKRKGNNIGSVP